MTKAKTPPGVKSSATKTLNAKRLESQNRQLIRENTVLKQRNRELELISQSFLAINSSL
jgi:hypothetical protein